MAEQSNPTGTSSPKPPPQQNLKTVQFRRDGKVSKDIPVKFVIPGIKTGKLLASDEISSDGRKWIRLDQAPHLSQYFQTAEVLEALKDYPKLPNPQIIPLGADQLLQHYKQLEDPVVKTEDNGWVLYPKSTFPLTLYGLNEENANKLKLYFDELCFSDEGGEEEEEDDAVMLERELKYEKYQQDILLMVTRNNLRCKEVESYIKVYKPFYMKKLEEQVKGSPAWEVADQAEKHSMLNKFKATAISSFEILYGINFQALFEGESSKLNMVTRLIEKYGAELLRFYFEKKKEIPYPGVHQLDKNNKKELSMFERLIKSNLALRGEQISISDILELVELEPLRLMLYDLRPSGFTDKNEAIEFASKVPDMMERAKKAVQLENLFQLEPFPETIGKEDFNDFLKGFEYAYEVFSLIFLTIMGADFNLRIYLDGMVKKGPWYVCNKYCCPSCKDLLKEEYPVETCPRLPHHVGCNCYLSLEKPLKEEKGEEGGPPEGEE